MRELDHPRDHVLSTYALDRTLVADPDKLEAHLAGCEGCTERLKEIRAFDALLAEPESWPDFDRTAPAHMAPILFEAAARARREDAEAEALLKALLTASPEAFVWADLPSKPQYFTAGVVRWLAAAAESAWNTTPRHSLNIADTAIALAGSLPVDTYTDIELAAAHGVAWKQRANALRHLGKHGDALDSLALAERFYRALPRPEYDLASISFIRGTIYFEQQRYDIAEVHADAAAVAFKHLGQTDRLQHARHLLASIAFEMQMIDRAEDIFRSIYEHFRAANDLLWIARGEQALGNCAIERTDFVTADRLLRSALGRFRILNATSSAVRCSWALALIPARSGSMRVAAPRLREVRDAFVELGAACDAALVTLDLLEVLARMGNSREARREAAHVVTIFREAGMLTGALTAATFLKRTATAPELLLSAIAHVRKFFRLIEYQPDLAFVPPAL